MGCGSGALGHYLKTQKNCYVVGVDIQDLFSENRRASYDQAHQLDLEKEHLVDALPVNAQFDYIVCADIIEHLREPQFILDQLSEFLAPDGKVLFSIPNISYKGVLLDLIDGQFNYTDTGILDDTHIRFYTYDSIYSLLAESDYAIEQVDRVFVDLALSEFSNNTTQNIPPAVLAYLEKEPDNNTYQYIVTAVPAQSTNANGDKGYRHLDQLKHSSHKVPALGATYLSSVFWRSEEEQYTVPQSSNALAQVGTSDQWVELTLPKQETSLGAVRFDPADRPGTLIISEMEIKDKEGTLLWQWSENKIVPALKSQHDALLSIVDNTLVCFITGQDPHFDLPLPTGILEKVSQGCVLRARMSWPQTNEYSAIMAATKDAREYQHQISSLNQEKCNTEQKQRQATQQLTASLSQAEKTISELQTSNAHLHQQLELIRTSRIWPLFLLIRIIKTLAVRLSTLLSNTLYHLETISINGIIDSADSDYKFQSIDSDPQFIVAARDNVPLMGWYEVTVEMGTETKHANSKLYIDRGTGFSEKNSYPLEKSKSKKTGQNTTLTAFIWLPPNFTRLRIDPIDHVGKFNFHGANLKPVSLITVFSQYGKTLLSAITSTYSATEIIKKSVALIRQEGPRAYLSRIRHVIKSRLENDMDHQQWFDLYQRVDETERQRLVAHCCDFEYQPKISILMPVYNVPVQWLVKAIESIENQIYSNWELCIANDASTDPAIAPLLDEYQQKDKRIKVIHRPDNGHISAASNSALALASGEYVSLLDHDDEFTDDALYRIVQALNENPELNILYSDEDLIDTEDMLYRPHFKSSWNPDLFHCQNYLCHLMTYRTQLVRSVAGFRTGVEGAQDYDLALRCIAKVAENSIHHIPRILYHWRAIEGSTAKDLGEKDYATAAGIKALEDYFLQIDPNITVERGPWPTTYRPRYPIPAKAPSVTLVIPNRDAYEILKRCIDSILEKTDYTNFSILIIDNGSTETQAVQYLEQLNNTNKVRVVKYDQPFNFSAINNFAIGLCDTPIVGLLNNDLEVISTDWLTKMVSNLLRPEIGVVGAKLYYPNDTIQHAGVILGLGPDGVAGHSHKTFDRNSRGYIGRLCLPQNLSAVTAACLLVKKEVYTEVGGLDQDNLKVAFNDVDFCLKIRAAGYRVYWEPDAELYHYESATRGYEDTPEKKSRFNQEKQFMHQKWGDTLGNDPYYNPNLTQHHENFSVAWPPRESDRLPTLPAPQSHQREIV